MWVEHELNATAFERALADVQATIAQTGVRAAEAAAAMQAFSGAWHGRRQHRSGHKHRGTRAWARRYAHRR